MAEIGTIGRLRHRNILQLQGWSHEEESLLLVYDYMAKKSLNEFLSGRCFLDWKTRYKILNGLASALLYLHEECGDPVVHRDVKPSNVMLDADFNPRLGDFGLARLLKNTQGVTTMVAGTLGYMAPEVSYTGKATTESDVYSFGVVALEVVCGKRFSNLLGESCLVDYAWDMHANGKLVECVDPKLGKNFDEGEAIRILRVSLACLHLDSNLRPTMRKWLPFSGIKMNLLLTFLILVPKECMCRYMDFQIRLAWRIQNRVTHCWHGPNTLLLATLQIILMILC